MFNSFDPSKESAPLANTGRIIEKRSKYEEAYRVLERCSSVSGHLIKVAALGSSVLGTTLLIAYLHSEGAPFPSLESGALSYIALVAAAFVLVFVPLGLFLMTPDFSKGALPGKSDDIFPELSMHPARRSFGPYLLLYSTYYATFLTFALIHLSYGRYLDAYGYIVSVAVSTVVGITAAFVLARKRLRRQSSWRWIGSFVWLTTRLLYGSAVSVCWLVSLVYLLTVLLAAKLTILAIDVQWNWFRAGLLALVLLHLLFTASITSQQKAVIGALILGFAAFAWPGWGFLGGMALRYLGAGGTVPVTIVVKPMAVGSPAAPPKMIDGCLILAVGNDLLLREADVPSECKLEPEWVWGKPRLEPPYSRLIKRFNRADILAISGFPHSCYINDGRQTHSPLVID